MCVRARQKEATSGLPMVKNTVMDTEKQKLLCLDSGSKRNVDHVTKTRK